MNNLLHFPLSRIEPELETRPAPQDNRRVRLFDGKVVLFKRPEYRKDHWHYSIQTDQGYERKSTKTSDLEQATKVVTDRWQEIQWRQSRGLGVQATTFEQAASAWIKSLEQRLKMPGKHSNVAANIRLLKRHIIPFFGNMQMARITASDITAYHADYLTKWENRVKDGMHPKRPSSASMRLHEGLITQIYDHAIENGMITDAERVGFKLTKRVVGRRGAFSEEETRQLLECLETRAREAWRTKDRKPRRLLWLYVRFLLLTGMRPGVEPCSVRFRDIEDRSHLDPPHVIVQVRDGKRGPRKAICPAEVLLVVSELRTLHGLPSKEDGLFLLPKRDNPRFEDRFRLVMDELALKKDAEGNNRSLYSCRHTAITRMLEQGYREKWIADNCGTSVQHVSTTYAHVIHLNQYAELAKAAVPA